MHYANRDNVTKRIFSSTRSTNAVTPPHTRSKTTKIESRSRIPVTAQLPPRSFDSTVFRYRVSTHDSRARTPYTGDSLLTEGCQEGKFRKNFGPRSRRERCTLIMYVTNLLSVCLLLRNGLPSPGPAVGFVLVLISIVLSKSPFEKAAVLLIGTLKSCCMSFMVT